LNKFRALLINEYVKIFCRLSTLIMLGVVVLTALWSNVLTYTFQRSDPATRFSLVIETPQDRIARLEAHRPDGWRRQVERYTYIIENDIPLSFTTVTNHPHMRQDPEAWRTEAVYQLFDMRWAVADREFAGGVLDGFIAATEEAIHENDWFAFVEAKLGWQTLLYNRSPSPGASVDLWALGEITARGVTRGSWQYTVIEEMRLAKHMDTDQGFIILGEYRLQNDVASYTYRGIEADSIRLLEGNRGFWPSFAASMQVMGAFNILGVLAIIIAGRSVAAEHSSGTIKFLLINPVARWKVLLAKYAAVLTAGLGMLALLFIANFIFAGVFFGFEGTGAPYLSIIDGEAVNGSSFLYMASRYLIGAVGILALATFAFALSALVRSSALAVGLGVSLYLVGWSVTMVMANMGFYQARYVLFANTDLLAVINGSGPFTHHTLGFALLNIAVYMVVFLWTAWDAFVRADIK
jgi:ABC-type transport system involved in multi-copper enzyme maturation permease subunit